MYIIDIVFMAEKNCASCKKEMTLGHKISKVCTDCLLKRPNHSVWGVYPYTTMVLSFLCAALLFVGPEVTGVNNVNNSNVVEYSKKWHLEGDTFIKVKTIILVLSLIASILFSCLVLRNAYNSYRWEKEYLNPENKIE